MRRTFGILALVLASGVAARTQEAPRDPMPMPTGVPQDNLSQPNTAPPGGYRMEPGMTAPKIVKPVAAVYPDDPLAEGSNRRCLLSMVINPDGTPLFIHVVHSAGEAFDAAAIYAVRQSMFEPGLRDQKPVPIRAMVRFTFAADRAAALPEIVPPTFPPPANAVVADTPPEVIHRVIADFSEEARKKKISGNVVVSFLVTEEGLPADVHIVRGLGYGLDEKVIESVRQYRFKPAMKDGKPIAQHISMEVNFYIH